jgi:hypothetical protein
MSEPFLWLQLKAMAQITLDAYPIFPLSMLIINRSQYNYILIKLKNPI